MTSGADALQRRIGFVMQKLSGGSGGAVCFLVFATAVHEAF
jgi:hypothetical protein